MKMRNNDGNPSIFSPAELKVVELLARGYSEKEIADRLCISHHTVDNHLRNIKSKHGLNKNAEIILLYISSKNHKEFNLSKIREVGIGVILVMLNVCDYVK